MTETLIFAFSCVKNPHYRMTTLFDRVKSISDPTKYLINGYVTKCQNELFGDLVICNPYYNIPRPVNNLCMIFYQL